MSLRSHRRPERSRAQFNLMALAQIERERERLEFNTTSTIKESKKEKPKETNKGAFLVPI